MAAKTHAKTHRGRVPSRPGPYQILVLGTGSHVGKSLVAAGLCRVLSNRGWDVAPFKAQNMALNSAVADDGSEIGRAQWLQARAARVPSEARMNPVLLKPVRSQGSQLVLLGQAQGIFSTRAYFRRWPKVAEQVKAAWAALAAEHEALVLEGAGSPAEVNLVHRDLANLETARFSGAPFLLVADIERGGAFASVVGTLAILPAWLRRRCLGVVFNKFRGDVRLLDKGLDWLKRRGITCLGVLPYLPGLVLDEEDSLGLPSEPTRADPKKDLKIDIIRYPFIANFNDCLGLQDLRGLELRWVRPGQERSQPDLIILPGSKDTVADLELLRTSGEAARLLAWVRQGTWVLGICGGFQMLGRALRDPRGVDSGRRSPWVAGLGLLDVETVMERRKQLAQRRLQARTRWGSLELAGYEIHHGSTRAGAACRIEAGTREAPLLVSRRDGRVWGSYLHGLLDEAPFRDALLSALARARGKRWRIGQAGREAVREASLARWARHLEVHLDLSFLPSERR
jgi:adenosylcobyric acid synthase